MATNTTYQNNAGTSVLAPLHVRTVTVSGTPTSQAVTMTDLIAIDAVNVQVRSSAGNVKTADALVTISGNVVTVANGSSLTLAAGDIVTVFAVGTTTI